MADRVKWAVPDEAEMEAKVRRNDEVELPGRVERYRFVLAEFGPPTHMLFVGGMASALAINDLQRSFIYGNFLSTVLTAQAFIELTLGGSFASAGQDVIAGTGFSRLIDASLANGRIMPQMAERLHKLRRSRNPYAHHRKVLAQDTLELRMMESQEPAETVAEADAIMALELIVDFLRERNPTWCPGNEGEPVITM